MTSASGPVFIFCTSELVFGGTEGVGSCFHVLRSVTRFQRFRGRRVPFSCFARLNSLSTVSRASGPIFMFCATGLFSSGIEDAFSAVLRASGPVFMFCTPGLIFGGTEDAGSRIRVLCA
jgi:hypothetical protein